MEPVLPLSIVLSIASGVLSAIVTLDRKFLGMREISDKSDLKLNQRIDAIELRLAKEYVDKDDLSNILQRLDDRIDRMDYKLDQILIGYNKNAPKS